MRTGITIEVCGIPCTLDLELTRNAEGELSARVACAEDPDRLSAVGINPWLDADDWLWEMLTTKQYEALEREYLKVEDAERDDAETSPAHGG